MTTPASFPTRTKTKHDHELDLAFLTREAARVMPVVGSVDFPTEWDKFHARIDTVLTLWQRAPADPNHPPR